MKPRISLITLAVENLDASLAFYRDGLGLRTDGIVGQEFENGAVAFFELEGNLRLALYPRSSLAADAGLPADTPASVAFSLAHNVGSRREVDTVMQEAESAGGHIVKPAQETFWGGYAGYFRDPDQHLWEVAWNPAWSVPE